MSSSSSSSTVLKRADSTTIEDKFLVGYQGWFTCPGDGRPVHNGHHGWLHWFNKPLPDGGKPTIDLWPDVSDYTPDELFPVPWYTTSVPPSSSPMLARMSHDIQHMPSISPGQIMPGTSPHPPAAHSSGSTSATTSPASASSVLAPPSGSGGFVPGGSAGAGRFGDLGSKLSSTGQKILPSETWKRVE